MLRQYFMVKQCLNMIDDCCLAPLDRLRIEILLLQLKGTLLSKVFMLEMKCERCSEEKLRAVLEVLKDGDESKAAEVMEFLETLLCELTEFEKNNRQPES